MTISIINEKPLIFASADPAYPKLARILREQLRGLDPKPFSFKLAEGYAAMERYRFVYPAKHILFNLETRKAIKYFASEKVPQFLRELRRKVNDVDYVVKGISRLRYNLRIRFIEDRQGYCLQPHRDSSDTIFSFIFHLEASNPQTTIYTKIKEDYLSGNVFADTPEVRQSIAKIILSRSPGASITWGHAQFNGIPCAWTNVGTCYQVEWFGGKPLLSEYRESVLAGNFGEIYGIHNVNKGRINSSTHLHFNLNSFHGVRPVTVPSRKIVIMDLLAHEVNDPVLAVEGVGNDDDSFFIVYREDTCISLSRIIE